ncbi:tellurite resistance TerB C-terminal domain-containing protein [Oscillatoria sp. FACHB-1406]|uniref:tellurite resistance TerB C-terminal domain-containing protein n=1 Tax=Oscillatoria sp. FACHB-1406 TaxID=2692846 RepID=UPI001689987C|nr:tellurite resistance TerB C-terminal domain-containing protein [Oscillatoria sp. FACHB-1406]MBD2576445.1 hypothetical protein [Oscillatoria sp. FACHB-1406]
MKFFRFTIVIGVVIFIVSFGVTIAIARNSQLAFLSASLSVIASYIGGTFFYKRRLLEQRTLRNSLYNQIEELEQEEEQLYHSLYEATATQQNLEAHIHALQYESERLRLRVAELHNQRSLLHESLVQLKKEHQEQVEPLHQLQKQIQFLEQRQTQVKHSLEIKTTEVQQAETRLGALKLEIETLQNQLNNRSKQEEEIGDRTFLLERKRQELEQQVRQLQERLQNGTAVATQESADEAKESNIPAQLTPLLPKEWFDLLTFIDGLSDLEKETFEAIIDRDEQRLKEIADRHTTMPEVLIESLNESALSILGDTLLMGGNGSLIPEFHEEYSNFLKQPVQLHFKEFLSVSQHQTEESKTINY